MAHHQGNDPQLANLNDAEIDAFFRISCSQLSRMGMDAYVIRVTDRLQGAMQNPYTPDEVSNVMRKAILDMQAVIEEHQPPHHP